MRIVKPQLEAFAPTLSWFDGEYCSEGGQPIAIFDFDGVLCSPREDLVYKLPSPAGERETLVAWGQRHGISVDLYDTPYLRHLCLQIHLESQGSIPDRGPLLRLAIEMSNAHRPFFILTARSGVSAIRRALNFVDAHRLAPQEIFFVGRVSKGRQVALVRETVHASLPIVYFEDSLRHSRNSHAQSADIDTVFINWTDQDSFHASSLLDEFLASVRRPANGSQRRAIA
ncbi:MAG: hypothetical protein WA840_23955 [Caulobacteraceae bacterium]